MKIQNLPLIFVLILVLFTRLILFTGYGRYFFGDEIRYNRLIVTFKEAQKFSNPLYYLQGIFAIHARPGYAIIYTPAIWLEKQSRDNPDFIQNSKNDFPYGVMLNVILNSLMVLLIYLILKETISIRVAFLATVLIIFSISSVIYVRHMLPYDASLVILFFGLCLYIKTHSPFLFGLLTGLSFLVYPSYTYYLIPIPLLLLFFAKKAKNITEQSVIAVANKITERLHLRKIHAGETIIFSTGFVIVLLITETFSRVVGDESYLLTIQQLSASVAELKQGDFISALSFLAEYIRNNDGYWGIVMASLAPFVFLFRKRKVFLLLTLYLITIFMLFEVFSHLIPKTVLYGRTMRPFYLMLLVTAAIVFDIFFQKISTKLRVPVLLFYTLLITIVFINWWPRFTALKDLVYPAAMRMEAESYLQTHYGEYKLEDVYTKKRFLEDKATDPPILESGKFYLVNPTLVYPYFGNLSVPCEKEVLLAKEHALLFKAYRFEGFTREMRKYLANDPPKYQLIFCK